jgi:DNA helicase-2/ATP-dependent DNA helicase PcrA
LEDSGYLKFLASKEDEENLGFLDQFYKKIKSFEEKTIEANLKNFVEELNLELESGEEGKLEFDPQAGPEMIKVMTIHGAKGLEFKYVFLVSMVDKRFPSIERKDPIELPEELIKDIKPEGNAHLTEERRICYVAMTRAKSGLYFTSAEDYGGQRKKKISQFLTEMGYRDNSQFPCLAGRQAIYNLQNGILEKKSKAPVFEKIKSEYLPSHFSYSQLAAFEKCPLQYKFAFILKVPVKGKAVFSFGKTIHNTLHQFLREVNSSKKQSDLFGSEKPSFAKASEGLFENLLKIFEQNWIDEWYENKKQKDEYYKLGKKIIKEFYDDFAKNPPRITKINNEPALEAPFNLKISGKTLYGKIDRIDDLKDGIAIIDYKTGQAKEKLDFEDKEQLLIYQIAAEEVLKLKPKELVYHYLEENKKVSFLGTENDKQKIKEKISQEIGLIENSDFKATPGWQCKYCDFKNICNFAQK